MCNPNYWNASIGVFLALLVGSFVVPLVFLRSWWRWGVLGLVACLWGGWYWNHGGRQALETFWASEALKVRDAELQQQSDRIVAAGLLDSHHVLDFSNVFWLLADQGVPFVEVPTNGSKLSARALRHLQEAAPEWRSSPTAGPIARLSLGRLQSMNCAALPPPPDFRSAELPFPDSCVTVEYASQPTAPIELTFEPAKPRETYGSWRLRDRVSNRDIARLTTSDTANRAVLRSLKYSTGLDCRFPQALLVRRLVGPKPGDGTAR